MSDLRESVDTPSPDAARVKELDAVADAKAFDPRTPTYNPADHVTSHPREATPAPGLNSPVLLSLSAKVRAASADRFPSLVGGTDDDDPAPVRSDTPHEGDRDVPRARERPRWVDELRGSDESLLESTSDAVGKAHASLVEVLGEAGDELTADDMREALQYVNPTRSNTNCVECAMAVDDILDGGSAVAGPTPSQPPYELRAALSVRSLEYLQDVTSAEVEGLLEDAGSGASGIAVGWRNQVPVHAYNAANIGGEVYWIDGQQDLMTEHDPHGFGSLEFYVTGTEGEQ